MEAVKVRLYYDFASTLCYVTHRVLTSVADRIEREAGVDLEWRPIDLTMAAPWSRGDSFVEEVRATVHATARSLGVDVEMPDPWLDSRPAAEIALRLDGRAAEARWRAAVFDTFFGQRPELTPELEELAAELLGGEARPGAGVVAGEEGFPLVEQSSREAFALGVTGVPTLLLDHWLFGGIHDGESMVEVLSEMARRYREQGAAAVN